MRITKSLKRLKRKSPGGNVTHFRKQKYNYAVCGKCGDKLNRPKLSSTQIRKLPKAERRPERPFPELCPKCMKEHLKEKVRS